MGYSPYSSKLISDQISRSVMSYSLRPHESQHATAKSFLEEHGLITSSGRTSGPSWADPTPAETAVPQAQSLLLGERLKLLLGLSHSTSWSPQSSCTDYSAFRDVQRPVLGPALADRHITP